MESARESRTQALGSRYELEELLGVGAMGEVWRALDHHTGRHVAAKVLRAEYARDNDIVTRFIQERSILLSLTHPNIVRVRDLVVEGERLAIVMDLVEGGDLRRHLRANGPVAPDQAVPLVCVVLDALASAHAAGCLHRDVKPDNVLLVAGDVSKPEDARLSDFSIARLAHESTVQSTGLLGTPSYMPPELFRDGRFSAASDVYATGILLYEMLGGRTPFAGSGTAHTIGHRHVSSSPPRIPVADELWQALERMLNKEPRARLSAAATAAVLRALPREALSAEPLPVQPMPDNWLNVVQTVVRRAPVVAPEITDPLPGSGARKGRAPLLDDTDAPERAHGASGDESLVEAREAKHRGQAPGSAIAAARRGRLPWALGAAVLVLGVGGLAFAQGGDDPAPGSAPGNVASVGAGAVGGYAQVTDSTLPIGLTVARTAEYDPERSTIDVTITYSAASAPLAGPFLEVFPAAVDGAECPLARWSGTEQQLSATKVTGVRSLCPAYVVEVPALRAQGREEVKVTLSDVSLDLAEDPSALQAWLDDTSATTSAALAGPSVGDEQFPAQRVVDIWVRATPFSVRLREEVRVEVGPRFVNGDEGPAFFDSFTATGAPSGFLQQIAGGYNGVQLSACSALAVIRDRQVIATQTAETCFVKAEVGKILSARDSVVISGAGS